MDGYGKRDLGTCDTDTRRGEGDESREASAGEGHHMLLKWVFSENGNVASGLSGIYDMGGASRVLP